MDTFKDILYRQAIRTAAADVLQLCCARAMDKLGHPTAEEFEVWLKKRVTAVLSVHHIPFDEKTYATARAAVTI